MFHFLGGPFLAICWVPKFGKFGSNFAVSAQVLSHRLKFCCSGSNVLSSNRNLGQYYSRAAPVVSPGSGRPPLYSGIARVGPATIMCAHVLFVFSQGPLHLQINRNVRLQAGMHRGARSIRAMAPARLIQTMACGAYLKPRKAAKRVHQRVPTKIAYLSTHVLPAVLPPPKRGRRLPVAAGAAQALQRAGERRQTWQLTP